MALMKRARQAWNDAGLAKDAFLFGFFLGRSEAPAERFEDELWRARGRGFRTGLMIALGLDTVQARAHRLNEHEKAYASPHLDYKTCPACDACPVRTKASFCDVCNVCIACGFAPPEIPEGFGCSECGGFLNGQRHEHTRICSQTQSAAGARTRNAR